MSLYNFLSTLGNFYQIHPRILEEIADNGLTDNPESQTMKLYYLKLLLP